MSRRELLAALAAASTLRVVEADAGVPPLRYRVRNR